MAGKYGTEWTVFAFLILDAPWWAVYNVESSLPLFIIAYGAESKLANPPSSPPLVILISFT